MSQLLLIHLQEHPKEAVVFALFKKWFCHPDVLWPCEAITLDEVRSAQSLNRKG